VTRRILHLIPTLTGGGAERQLAYITRELIRRGNEVRIAYLHEGNAPWVKEGLPAFPLPRRHSWSPLLIRDVVSLIRSWRADVVQTWILQMDVIGGIAAAMTRTPWILREPTTAVFYRGAKPRLRLLLARAGAGAVIANSEGGMTYWEQKVPALRRRFIFNAVPIDEIEKVAPAEIAEHPVALFAGRLQAMKNVDVFLRAAARLMTESELRVIICGDGPARSALDALTRQLDIADRVTFTGHTPNVWRYMKAADVFVSLSDFEGSPNAVLEAFAAGTPVLLSDIPAHRAISDSESAWFTPLHDVDATAAVMRELLSNRDVALQRARSARARIARSSVAAVTDAFESVYDEVLAGRGR
jgi:glycosyltransferase involved in cell wall biosynthesis